MCQVHLEGQVSAHLVLDFCPFIYSKPSSAYLKVLKVQGQGQGLSPASEGSSQGSWTGTWAGMFCLTPAGSCTSSADGTCQRYNMNLMLLGGPFTK